MLLSRSCATMSLAHSRPCVAARSVHRIPIRCAGAAQRRPERGPQRQVKLHAAEVSTAQTQTTASEGLLLLDTSTFYQYLEDAGDTLVVVDFYTDWCGPCKVIYPELVKLAQERPDIRIVKFNCNKANKDLGVKLGIKVAPTFHLYKRSQKVAEMTGAKMDQLIALIDKAMEPEA